MTCAITHTNREELLFQPLFLQTTCNRKLLSVVIRIMVTIGRNAVTEIWLSKHGYIATTVVHTRPC